MKSGKRRALRPFRASKEAKRLARLRLGSQTSPLMEFEYDVVAQSRGELAWCAALAQRVREQARQLLAGSSAAHAR